MDHESPATETRARVTVRRLRTAWMLGLLSMVMAMATAPGALPVGARLALVAMCATLLALAGWFWKGRVFDGALTVDDRGMTVGGLHFARADVLEGMAIPGFNPRVQLTLRGGTLVEVAVESLEAADAMLDGLDLDPRHRALRFPARSPWKQAAGALGGVMVGSYIGIYLGMLLAATGVRFAVALAAPLSLIFATMGSVSTRPIEVRVGTDGITLRGAFKTRFIPFADLSGVGENSGDPMLYYRDGHTEVIWNCAVSRQPDLLAALQHRVNGALATNAEHEGLMARAAILARQGRPLALWQAELGRAVDPTQGYRNVGLSRRDAEAVLDDARSPVEHRIGAALALRSLDAAEAPTRVRVAAAGCASPEMRAALESAGDGTLDEQTVARAVAAVEKGRGWT